MLQGSVSRHGLLDTFYPLREHLNNVRAMVSGGYCQDVFSDTVCWPRLNTSKTLAIASSPFMVSIVGVRADTLTTAKIIGLDQT